MWRGLARLAGVAITVSALAGCGSPSSATPGPTATALAQVKSGPLGDTWTWDGRTWTRVTVPGPPARFDSAMGYDEAKGEVILFGGSLLLSKVADTWRWDGKSWTRLQPAHAPDTRSGQGMAYDRSRGQLILYGGGHGVGERSGAGHDTWAWDGADWTHLSDVGPPLRQEWAMAFDPELQKVVIFGGSLLNTQYHDDTWAWDGHSWAAVPVDAGPSPRRGASMAYDAARKRLLLFGGAVQKAGGSIGGAGTPVADTWALTASGWARLSSSTSPSARSGAVLAQDPVGGGLILFGGYACPFTNQTWSWDGDDWRQLHPASAPQARVSGMMATDLKRKLVVLYGGLADTPCI